MAEESLITDEMRAAIGQESEPVTHEVDRTAIRMFARAVGHTDPIFYDVKEAQAAGYRDLPCPPGYLGTPIFDPAKSDPTSGRRRSNAQELQASRPLTRRLNGGTEIEYFADICAGDVLAATTHLADVQERKGSLGPMLISTSKTTYRDQSGRVVAIMTGTGIRY
jgi:hypothetical protein